jgi:hypothetical protein
MDDQVTPKARKTKLIIKELADEVLVYDEDTHKAHCLNHTSALIWKFCDGRTNVPKMVRRLETAMNVTVPEETVWLALKQLDESRLLVKTNMNHGWMPQVSRRAVMRTIGMAAIALPVITSITNPTAAAAASCKTAGQPCSGAGLGNCCPGMGLACQGAGPTCQVT